MLDDADVTRVLVVTAHPDDVDFGASGTISLWTSAGIAVTYCVITDGDAGGFDPHAAVTPGRDLERGGRALGRNAHRAACRTRRNGVRFHPRSACDDAPRAAERVGHIFDALVAEHEDGVRHIAEAGPGARRDEEGERQRDESERDLLLDGRLGAKPFAQAAQ